MSSASGEDARRHEPDEEFTDRATPGTLTSMSVPPDSCVLDIGAMTGTVAAALRDRGSRVWATEVNPEAAARAAEHCEQIVVADAETLDFEEVFGQRRFDFVLLLDVLAHLRDPVATLRRALQVLKPDGRVIVSLPNVTHGAVRLRMLQGRFPYTDTGSVDRAHLRFFDRSGMNRLLIDAGCLIEDELPIRRPLTQTEMGVDLDPVAPEILAQIRNDPDSEIYQFFVVAAPVAAVRSDRRGGLATELWQQLHELSRTVAEGARYAAELERQLVAKDEHTNRLAAEVTSRDSHLEQAARDLAAGEAARALLSDNAERIQELERLLKERMGELQQGESEHRQLRLQVGLRESHLSELRQSTAEAQEAAQQAVAERDALRTALDETRARAEELELSLREAIRRQTELDSQLGELRQRMLFARYRIADRISATAKRLPVVHRPAKRTAERLFPPR